MLALLTAWAIGSTTIQVVDADSSAFPGVHVTDEDGFAFPGVHVSLNCDGHTQARLTDADGNVSFEAADGPCSMTAHLAGFESITRELPESHDRAALALVLREDPDAQGIFIVMDTPLQPFRRPGASAFRLAIHGEGGFRWKERWARSYVTMRPTRNGTRVRYHHREGRSIRLFTHAVRLPGAGQSHTYSLPKQA